MRSQNALSSYGSVCELPLYNQPEDTEVFHANLRLHRHFRKHLLSHLRRRAAEEACTQRRTAEEYEKQVTNWLKKVDTKTLKKKLVSTSNVTSNVSSNVRRRVRRRTSNVASNITSNVASRICVRDRSAYFTCTCICLLYAERAGAHCVRSVAYLC